MGLNVLHLSPGQDEAVSVQPPAAQQRALWERTSVGEPGSERLRLLPTQGSLSAEIKGMKARPPSPSWETCHVTRLLEA